MVDEEARRLIEHARELLPEIVGGFLAYVLHSIYHVLWRRPAHFLVRLITRKKGAGHH